MELDNVSSRQEGRVRAFADRLVHRSGASEDWLRRGKTEDEREEEGRQERQWPRARGEAHGEWGDHQGVWVSGAERKEERKKGKRTEGTMAGRTMKGPEPAFMKVGRGHIYAHRVGRTIAPSHHRTIAQSHHRTVARSLPVLSS